MSVRGASPELRPGWSRIGGPAPQRHSGLDDTLARPTTALLLLVQMAAFGWIKWRGVTPASVGLSAQSLYGDREYRRLVTSAFAHFDVMHLLFNVSSTCALGGLEDVLGSFPYFAATAVLVPATGVACCALVVALSRTDGDASRRRVPAVGFSSVLFAWIVVATLRSRSYCLMPGVDATCFATRQLGAFGFNPAPFVLAVLIQVVVPRASFCGHAAGVALGYPLAWVLGS